MFDTLSIRLKIVLLSGLCLLGVIALVVGINIYNTNQNDRLVSDSSSRMLTASVEQLLAVNPAWLLVAHYREESIVKRWQQDPLWQILTAAQKQQVASVDSNAWARMRGIFAAERIAADTVKIFHHQPLTDVK